jgi:predicted ABC-type ATPase
MRRPQLIIVAGPNGVGKSTYSRAVLASRILLVDPDRSRIGSALGNDVEQQSALAGGRLAVRSVREALSQHADLVVETTLSGKSPIRLIESARRIGYDITLLYIGLEDPDECVRRVRHRVARGGHNVPEADIRRRFVRSIEALPAVVGLVDQVILYDNAADAPYRRVAQFDLRTTKVAAAVPAWAENAIAAIIRRSRA